MDKNLFKTGNSSHRAKVLSFCALNFVDSVHELRDLRTEHKQYR